MSDRVTFGTDESAIVARFVVHGEPTSKSRARFTGYGHKTRAYTPEKTKTAEIHMAAAFRRAGGVLEPDSEATFGVRATFHNGTRQRRDVDNMLKLVLDGLNGVAWKDDTQVVEVAGLKRFTTREDARTEVTVYRVGVLDRITKPCEHCGIEFITYPSLVDVTRFCSRKCGDANRRRARARTCDECGAEFLAHGASRETRFCGRECQARNGWTEVKCAHCGVIFPRRKCHVHQRNFCTPKCRDANLIASRKLTKKGGICIDCAGPTADKRAKRCQPCQWKNLRNQRGDAA